MSTPVGSGLRRASGFDAAADSAIDGLGSATDFAVQTSDTGAMGLASGRWLGWRRRALVMVALLGCVGLFTLLRYLAGTNYLDASWRTSSTGQIELLSASDPQLRQRAGQFLRGVESADGQMIPGETLVIRRSPRWIVDDADRTQQIALEAQLASALLQPTVRLHFDGLAPIEVAPRYRGYAGLGAVFWPLIALALVFYLVGAVVVLVRPDERNLLYGLIALSQTTNLLLISLESLQGFGLPAALGELNGLLRLGCDVVACGAIIHAATVHPRHLPHRGLIALGIWALAAGFIALAATQRLNNIWWWTQAFMLTYSVIGCVLLTWSYRLVPHPFSIVLRRLGVLLGVSLGLLTLAVAMASREPGVQHSIASVGSVIWYVFFASIVMLVPFLSRTQQVMREFTLLAGLSTVATSLDLLFVAVFALGQFTSLTLALFLALGLYAGTRQWVMNQLMGSNMLTTERMFESLYRIAREIEAAGTNSAEHLSKLLREMFEPLEVSATNRVVAGTRVVGDGSTLLVPLPRLPGIDDENQANGAIVLRFARRGRRMFTHEDARLTDRVLEQLVRAIAFDRAVEQGRNEERARIAQDLHDDIGARLLTLMYKAQSPEMEDYVRHTLQDLKTLTRGLAASSHLLSHASAEWKADITQRLIAAQCTLHWTFEIERDVNLTVVQWSALTRMLRELINNVIAHAEASRVDVSGQFERGRFTLKVSDDGVGRRPDTWSHGLGLGGIRKRVKLLGGEVRWRENAAQGVVCELRVPELGERL